MASPSDAAADDILALGLTEMQAILGDSAPRTTYERLLREAKGDVSAALNRFFDTGGGGPPAPSPWCPPSIAAGPLVSSTAGASPAPLAPPADGWPRLLGCTQVAGICLGSVKHGELREWEPLVLQVCRQQPKARAKAAKGAKAAKSGKGPAKGAALPFGQAEAAATVTILRFSPAADPTRQLGRLPSSLTDCLAPLLDEDKVEVKLCCAAVPTAGVGIGEGEAPSR